MYADIIVDISHENLDKIYQYRIPDELLSQVFVGVQVNIPFGMGNRTIKGYVIGISKDLWQFIDREMNFKTTNFVI